MLVLENKYIPRVEEVKIQCLCCSSLLMVTPRDLIRFHRGVSRATYGFYCPCCRKRNEYEKHRLPIDPPVPFTRVESIR